MFDNNGSVIKSFNSINPYSKVDTANGMPINHLRLVEPVNHGNRSREYVEKQNFKNIYSKNLSPAIGSTTESFIKSKETLSPVFSHNEAKTRYDMVSKLENKIQDVRKQVEVLA
tara:strand:- start:805 stop:1146 length:342 start_codon:yes stop_codon:yes gene_type:complete